eukprot:3440436-Rhodomonas_salina.1
MSAEQLQSYNASYVSSMMGATARPFCVSAPHKTDPKSQTRRVRQHLPAAEKQRRGTKHQTTTTHKKKRQKKKTFDKTQLFAAREGPIPDGIRIVRARLHSQLPLPPPASSSLSPSNLCPISACCCYSIASSSSSSSDLCAATAFDEKLAHVASHLLERGPPSALHVALRIATSELEIACEERHGNRTSHSARRRQNWTLHRKTRQHNTLHETRLFASVCHGLHDG